MIMRGRCAPRVSVPPTVRSRLGCTTSPSCRRSTPTWRRPSRSAAPPSAGPVRSWCTTLGPMARCRCPTRRPRWRGRRATSACASASRWRCATATHSFTATTARSSPPSLPRSGRRSRRGSCGPRCPPAEWIALVDAVADRITDDMVSVQYGPAGPQWCSDALLAAIAEASARTGRRIHMHLLETRYQRDWADRTYPEAGGIVAHLERLGLLSPRLTLAHCVWARPDELERIAASGATIAVNTSSNLGLRSGIAPVAEMLRRGCRIALGIDGMAFDEDDDGLREMRLLWALHRGWGFDETIPRAQHARPCPAQWSRNGDEPEGGRGDRRRRTRRCPAAGCARA
ncbi:MAG: amidohydrolase family protein [Acetobacteraceae bacterium]|nr:amidohydrolase family protein [Acetobacteraceae bacterium]